MVISVKNLAKNLKMSSKDLITYLQVAGINILEDQSLSYENQLTLLRYLQENSTTYQLAFKVGGSMMNIDVIQPPILNQEVSLADKSEDESETQNDQEQQEIEVLSTYVESAISSDQLDTSNKPDVPDILIKPETIVELPVLQVSKAAKSVSSKTQNVKEKTVLVSTPISKQVVTKKTVIPKVLIIPDKITLSQLAKDMKVSVSALIETGWVTKENKEIDSAHAAILADHFHYPYLVTSSPDKIYYNSSSKISKPPVVSFLGHVDHGKTSLIDRISSTKVTATEAGLITQHIRACTVTHKDQIITIIDTPGHQAFDFTRKTGANLSDICILVIAADDGLMPQHYEIIEHFKSHSATPIIAINKIDLPNINVERIYEQLSAVDLLPEKWGGETVTALVSAKTGEGIEELLDSILLVHQINEITVSDGPGQACVLDIAQHPKLGVVLTVIVQQGILRQGDTLVSCQSVGKIRNLKDHRGVDIKEALAGTPVQIVGMSATFVNQMIYVVDNDKEAKQLFKFMELTADSGFVVPENQVAGELSLVLKATHPGMLDALQSLVVQSGLPVSILKADTGLVTYNDIHTASLSGSVIIAFDIKISPAIQQQAEENKVLILQSDVIYHLIDQLDAHIQMLTGVNKAEVVTGKAEVIAVFSSSAFKTIAGCLITEGEMKIDHRVRVIRNGKHILTSQIRSLRQVDCDIETAMTGIKCGIGIKGYEAQIGDLIEAI